MRYANNSIVTVNGTLYSVLREQTEWGIRTLDVVSQPRRFWSDQSSSPSTVETGVDINRVLPYPSPAQLLQALPQNDNWSAQSRRSIARLWAYFLICEDPQRRLDAREVVTLSHQISLVKHILEHDNLKRVLIADEVGLGKTIESGLLIKELLELNPGLRILYLAPARLVSNVIRELHRLELYFRQWKSGESDARLSDPLIVASIHRAVHNKHTSKFTDNIPWDIIIVDECHHLSDWAEGGGDPVEKYKLVRDLVLKQRPESRLILMSGTPHQGHTSRFNNLLKLLKKINETDDALNGRVIYRTKEDVKDWHGNPLFPQRQVNDPIVVDLGIHYQSWLQNIYSYYKPTSSNRTQQRAAGWRCAQALQWAASSPQAGLGYLVRQALRAGWNLKDKILYEAVGVLRPYRNGSDDEPVEQLLLRMLKEVEIQNVEADIEDIEDDISSKTRLSSNEKASLEALIQEGITILKNTVYTKWQVLKQTILDHAGDEKLVLFAQPIETITALVSFLEKETGIKPAIIIGGQSDDERREQIERFWQIDGPRYLVSSRAGGEGINLQIARRLVHLDIPWNPMDLEQRVGRVHRFGSKRTIIVDTLVVKNSREADAYRIAREKLKLIASTVVGSDRFETIFSRVMCLVAPEELQDLLIEDPVGPLNIDDSNRLSLIIESGFKSWKEFHENFAAHKNDIHAQEPGLATWQDILDFLKEYGASRQIKGFTRNKFTISNGNVNSFEEQIDVLQLNDNKLYYSGEYEGAIISNPEGQEAQPLGLNKEAVTTLLRKAVFPENPSGAAYLRWAKEYDSGWIAQQEPIGLLFFVKQIVKTEQSSRWVELSTSLLCYAVLAQDKVINIEGDKKDSLVRALTKAAIKMKPLDDNNFINTLSSIETSLIDELKRPPDEDIRYGIRYAITPVFAAIISK